MCVGAVALCMSHKGVEYNIAFCFVKSKIKMLMELFVVVDVLRQGFSV